MAVFCSEDCKIEKTEIKIKLGEYEEFILKGNVIKEAGWTKYDEYSKNDKFLPKLNIGDSVNIDFKLKEKKNSEKSILYSCMLLELHAYVICLRCLVIIMLYDYDFIS